MDDRQVRATLQRLPAARRARAAGLSARRPARRPEPGARQAVRRAQRQRGPLGRGGGPGGLGEPPAAQPLHHRRTLPRSTQVQGALIFKKAQRKLQVMNGIMGIMGTSDGALLLNTSLARFCNWLKRVLWMNR